MTFVLVTSEFYSTGPRLERFARDKHFSLLQKFVTCSRKKFYNIGPWFAVGSPAGGVGVPEGPGPRLKR